MCVCHLYFTIVILSAVVHLCFTKHLYSYPLYFTVVIRAIAHILKFMFIHTCLLSISAIEFSQAVRNYLASSDTSPGNHIDNVDTPWKQIEREALSRLGPVLGRCAECLLVIAMLHVRSLSKVVRINDENSFYTASASKDFGAAVGVAVEYANIETAVR